MAIHLRSVSVAALGLASALLLGTAALAQHGDHGGGKEEKSDSKMKMDKGMGKGGKMSHMAHESGSESEMCHGGGHGGMPPHYCEPMYKVMSSVRGVAVEEVAAAGDKAVMVTLSELNVNHPGVSQKVVIVGGGGDLAGAVIVDGGWKNEKKVQLDFIGDGSIYSQGKLHVHIFPVTGP